MQNIYEVVLKKYTKKIYVIIYVTIYFLYKTDIFLIFLLILK